MKKFFLFLVLMALAATPTLAADVTIGGLTLDPAPTTDDMVETENDPSGTPASKKAALGTITVGFADALSSDPTGCPARQYPTDLDSDADFEGCTPEHDEVTITGHNYVTLSSQLLDFDDVILGTHTFGPYVASATSGGFLVLTGSEAGTLGLNTGCGVNAIPKWDGDSWECAADADSGAGTGAPTNASTTYLTLSISGTLLGERRFVPGNGMTATDGGAGGDYTLAAILKTVGENGVGNTSSASGLEFESAELTMLQGCADGQLLKWTESSDTWGCASDTGGTITGTDTHCMFFDGSNNPSGDAGCTYNKTTDSLTLVGNATVATEAYDATGWNSDNTVPTKNDVRDKIEAIIVGAGSTTDTGSVTHVNDVTDSFTVGGTTVAASDFVMNPSTNNMTVRNGTIYIGDGTDVNRSFGCLDLAGTDVCFDYSAATGRVTLNAPLDTTGTVSIIEADLTAEQIRMDVDDFVEFQGGGGADNTDLRLDLDGAFPILDSPTDSVIGVAETLRLTGITGSTQCLHVDTNGDVTGTGSDCGAGAGATAWDDIGDADGLGTISFAGFDQDITSAEDGGDILTIGTTDADQASDTTILRLYTNDTNDANTYFIKGTIDEDGTPNDTWFVAATGTTGAVTQRLGLSGVSLTTDGDGALTILGLGDGSDEALTLNFDDTSNTVVASSTTGVTSLNIGSISLTTTASLIVADEAYDATDWNGETDVPTKNAIRDKIEALGSGGTYSQIVQIPGYALAPLEAAADAFATIGTKDAGTNIDQLPIDFDASADECRTLSFFVGPDVDTAGTVLFKVSWYSAATTTGDAVWDVRHNGGVGEGTDPDQALTVETAAADAVQGTAGQLTFTTWTETVSNLGWASGDFVILEVCRDADNVSDNLANDARVNQFFIGIP